MRKRDSSSMLRGITSVAGGSAFGQLIALSALPWLSRLYTPAEFGIFSTLAAIAILMSGVLTASFERAIPLAATRRDSFAVAYAGFISAAALGLIALSVAIALGAIFDGISDWAWAAVVAAFFAAASLILNQLAIRDSNFRAIGLRNFLQPSLTSSIQLGFGVAGTGALGLVLGMLGGRVLSALGMVHSSGLSSQEARESRSIPAALSAMRRYAQFPIYVTPAYLLNTLGLQIPLLALMALYGVASAGYYGMANTALAAPVTLLGTAIGQVYLARLATDLRENTGQALLGFTKTSKALFSISVPVGLAISLAPLVFPIVLGSDWETAGLYAQALAVAVAARLFAAPLNPVLIALERTKLQLVIDTARVALLGIAVTASWQAELTSLSTVWVLSITLAVTYYANWLMCFFALRSRESSRA